jgi:hypothetical protein
VPARETSVPHGTTIVAWTLGSRLLSAAHGVPTWRAPDLRNTRQTGQIENTALNTLASLPEAQRLSDYLWVGRSSPALLHFRTVRAFRAQVLLRSPEWESGRAALGGLAILEACCFVGAAGGVAGAVRMSAGAR